MLYMLYSWIVSAAAFMLASTILPGFHVESLGTAFLGAAVLGVFNAIVRPVIILFTLPVTVLTLGLFLFVVNGLVLGLVAWLIPGIVIANLLWAIAAALVISIVNAVLGSILG